MIDERADGQLLLVQEIFPQNIAFTSIRSSIH